MQDIVTSLQQLDLILRREEAQCDALADNIQRERQALRTLTLTDMTEVNRQRAGLLDELLLLETERTAWVVRLADRWSLAPSAISLSVILERLETTDAQRLEMLYAGMAEKIRALRHEISINAGILNSLQAFIRKGLNVVRQATAPLGLYSESGAPRECGMGALMFRQKG
ncbi:MAG: flagellar export chaperone FlgN [Nitrospirae bacterium]|nr:flagellar export chaperone FlgN [Nitrospirota bacterium]